MAVPMYLTTLILLMTTPKTWEPSLGGLPVPGPMAGFLWNDVVLLAASAWLFGKERGAVRSDN